MSSEAPDPKESVDGSAPFIQMDGSNAFVNSSFKLPGQSPLKKENKTPVTSSEIEGDCPAVPDKQQSTQDETIADAVAIDLRVKSQPTSESRQRALTEELNSLLDVVGAAQLVELLLERSFKLGATDIHFDPQLSGMMIRLRLDGLLYPILNLETQYIPQLISRIKLLGGMDITERRQAQDGQISRVVSQTRRDVRIASGPTIHGERIVMRLMPDSDRFSSLNDLGMTAVQSQQVQRAIQSPFGVVLSVGPVGCGKSTTTYSCLNTVNDPSLSLVTIEDPVERQIVGVNQIQTDPRINFGFAEALRGILRQDPDVIMVGEIRDAETAHIAIRAGLTGTRVFSTLHAGDTGATIDMFREFQIPRLFLADAINCIIAQRLLRKVCQRNRETYAPDDHAIEVLNLSSEEAKTLRLVRGVPADENFQTGYYGRTGVFEVMTISEELRADLLAGKSGRRVAQTARENGMQTLIDSTRDQIINGTTSIDEMFRVLNV